MSLTSLICITYINKNIDTSFDSYRNMELKSPLFVYADYCPNTYSLLKDNTSNKYHIKLLLKSNNISSYPNKTLYKEDLISILNFYNDKNNCYYNPIVGIYNKSILFSDDTICVNDVIVIEKGLEGLNEFSNFVVKVVKIRDNWITRKLFGKFQIKFLTINHPNENVKYLVNNKNDFIIYKLSKINQQFFNKFNFF